MADPLSMKFSLFLLFLQGSGLAGRKEAHSSGHIPVSAFSSPPCMPLLTSLVAFSWVPQLLPNTSGNHLSMWVNSSSQTGLPYFLVMPPHKACPHLSQSFSPTLIPLPLTKNSRSLPSLTPQIDVTLYFSSCLPYPNT